MGYQIARGNLTRPLYFLLVSSADHVTGATGKTPAVTLLKSGGSFAAPAGSVAEVSNGLYRVAANATDADTIGPLFLHATASGCDPRDDEFEVLQDLSAAAIALSPSSSLTTAITATSIISRALKLIGVGAEGETNSQEMMNDGLLALNELIDSWGNERLMALAIARSTYTLTAAIASFTIGATGTWAQAWPQSIDGAGLIYTASSIAYELPLEKMTWDTYQRVTNKALASTWPTAFYYDHAYSAGLGTVNVWPVQDTSSYTIALYCRSVLSQFAGLSTTYAFPPGYAKALRYNLALDLAAEYPGAADPDKIARVERIANASKSALKHANFVPQEMRADPAILGTSQRGRWNINSDTPVR